MAPLRKKKAPASSAEDWAAVEAQIAATVEKTKAVEAEIEATAKAVLAKAVLKNAQSEAAQKPLSSGDLTSVVDVECDKLSGSPLEIFNRLNRKIRAYGKTSFITISKMVPVLAEMGQLLSQKRGWGSPLRGLDLPLWSKYLNNIAEEFDLSVRTLQRRLHEYRGEDNEEHPKRGKTNRERGIPPQLSPTDQRSLMGCAIAASDYLEAIERKGESTKPYLNALKWAVITPNRIQALMCGESDPREKAWDAFMVSVLKYTRLLEEWVIQHGTEDMKTTMKKRREEFRTNVPPELKPIYGAALYTVSTGKKPIPFLIPIQETRDEETFTEGKESQKKPVASECAEEEGTIHGTFTRPATTA
jgi:hypothetical protein